MYNEQIIREELLEYNEKIRFLFKEETESTNDDLDLLAKKGECEGLVIIAESQTGGKGRMGRTFHSPKGSGIYMSILLRPSFQAEHCNLLTPMAAVALCDALFEVLKIKADIKWVNDIYLDDKKAAGILTKAAFSGGSADYAIVGVGINVTVPKEGFHEDIKNIAGALKDNVNESECDRLTGSFLRHFMRYYNALPSVTFFDGYKNRLLYLGEKVTVTEKGGTYKARATDIDERFRLKVKTETGEERVLYTEEISVKADE